MKISGCIISNNDERIFDCIKSISDTCFEIIVAFNGDSQIILQQLSHIEKVKVYNYKWRDDFSHAKNFAMSKARGEFILNMDSDETLSDTIVALPDCDYFNFTVKIGEHDITSCRLIRNNLGIKYVNKVHEYIEAPIDRQRLCQLTEPHIVHHGYEGKTKEDAQKKLNYYLKLLEDDNQQKLYHYHKAQIMYIFGQYNECVFHARQLIESQVENEWKAAMSNLIYKCFIKLGIAALEDSIVYCPRQIFARNNLAFYEELQGNLEEFNNHLIAMEMIVRNNLSLLPYDEKINLDFLQTKIKEIEKCQYQQVI